MTSRIPRYLWVYNTLKKQIEDREYVTGDHLPPEPELEKKYNVSRTTIRKAVELLANLKMNLNEVYEELAVRDFYGKVVEQVGKDRDVYMIRFTAVPPEIGSYFEAFQQHSMHSE